MANDSEQLGLAAEVTVAWLSNPHTRAAAEDVSSMLGSVLAALRGLEAAPAPAAPDAPEAEYSPAVTVRRSLSSPDHIISMIDGKPYRSLTRHLRTHGLTPDQYRQRYGLKPDYPMIAPSYSAARRDVAKRHQFGRVPAADPAPAPEQRAASEAPTDPTPEAGPPARPRLSIAGAKQAAQAHLGTAEDGAPSESTQA